jgi:hypothetical protein
MPELFGQRLGGRVLELQASGDAVELVALEPTTNSLGGGLEARRRSEPVHLDSEVRRYELGVAGGEDGIARLSDAVSFGTDR